MAMRDLPGAMGGAEAALLLDDPGVAVRVTGGWADVFADLPVPGAAGAGGGRMRRHLFRAAAGTLLVGVMPGPAGALVAVAGPDARMEPAAMAGAEALRGWVAGLTEAAAGTRREWAEHILAPGWLRLAPGQKATVAPHQMLWVSVQDGRALLHGRVPLPGEEAWPLMAPGTIEAGPEGCMLAAAAAAPEMDLAALSGFGRAALACVADQVAREMAARGGQAREGEARGRAALQQALSGLAGEAGGREVSLDALSGDPLRVALAACCAAAGHAFLVPEAGGMLVAEAASPATPVTSPFVIPMAGGRALPERVGPLDDDADPLRGATAGEPSPAAAARAAVAARLRRMLQGARAEARAVTLDGAWWRTDGMPMLGWLGPERLPVALLPGQKPGRWRMVGVGVERPLDAAEAARIAPDAWQIYPALPGTPLRVRDVMRWAVRGLGADFRRVAVMGFLAALLGLALPAMTGVLFETVVPFGDVTGLATIAIGLLVAVLGGAAFQLVQALSVLRLEARLDGRMQAALMQRLLRLPPRFFRSYTVGELADRALGVQEAREMLTASTFAALLGAVFGTVSLGLMAFQDWRLALIGTGLVVVLAAVLGWLSLQQLKAERVRALESARVEGFVLQMLEAIGKLRAAAAEARSMAEWARRNLPLRRAAFAAAYWAALRGTAAAVLPTLALLCIFAAVAWLADLDARQALLDALTAEPTQEPRASLSIGGFVAFIAAFGGLMAAVTEAAMAMTRALAALPMLERLRPLLAAVPETPPASEPPPPLQGAIELRRVRFRYLEGAPEVLRDLSFAIRPGEYVAIVGRSGSGKSTVLRLILGFERPDRGDVWFDGRSTERLDLGALRRSIGVVLQNGRIGQGSMMAAIAGGSAATLDDCWSAARLAGLAREIEAMPMGMRTLLPDGAGTLSAGQRQRVLLARALVSKPRILVLDEATSALDNRTQAVVTETLASLPITRVVVAHRFSTVQGVDRVLVMEEGRLVEEGSPAALLAAGGHFAALARRQML